MERGCLISMVGVFCGGIDSHSDLESGSFIFWVVWRSEGLGLNGGYLLDFLDWSEDLGLDDGGGSFLL